MSIIDSLLSALAPYDCLNCETEGDLLCYDCSEKLSSIPERCYRCRKVSPGSLTCRPCRSNSKLYSVHVGTVYEGSAKELVWAYKFQGARKVARIMSSRLLNFLPPDDEAVIVPVPTATSRVRTRGYDQAAILAQELSRNGGKTYLPALVRIGQHHQVGATRRQRTTQLAGAFRVRKHSQVEGKHVILIDDVLTTGATLEAATRTLREAGAKRVSAIVFAQA